MERIQKCFDALPAIRHAHNSQADCRRGQQGHSRKTFPAYSCDEQNDNDDESEGDRLSQVGLRRNQTAEETQNQQTGEQPLDGLVDFVPVLVEEGGHEDQEHQFGDF